VLKFILDVESRDKSQEVLELEPISKNRRVVWIKLASNTLKYLRVPSSPQGSVLFRQRMRVCPTSGEGGIIPQSMMLVPVRSVYSVSLVGLLRGV